MKLTKSCYAVMGFGYSPPWVVNAGFIVGQTTTLIIDSGPSKISAQTLYGYAQSPKPDNKIIVVNTEKHLDHIGGNSYFREKGLDVYGSEGFNRKPNDLLPDLEEMNQSIPNEKRRTLHEEKIFFEGTEIVNPNKIVKPGDSFDLGDIRADLIFTPGHTATNISVLLKEEKVIYTGDCITNKYLPNLEAGNKNDWSIWLNSLDLISSFDLNFIVPGHGNVIESSEIKSEIQRIREVLKNAIKENKPPTVV